MRHGAVLAFLFAILLAIVASILFPAEGLAIALPILAVLSVTLPSLYLLYLRKGSVPLDDIGALYIAAITIYAVFPLATYLARGMTLSKYSDYRLLMHLPTPAEMMRIGWLHVVYCSACSISYILNGRRLKAGTTGRALGNTEPAVLPVCIGLLVLVQLFLVMFAFFYGVGGETYTERNRSLAQLYLSAPQILKQLHVHADGVVIILKTAVLIFLFRRFQTYRWVIATWYTTELILTIAGLGARTPLVYLSFAFAILYHRFVAPVPAPVALVGGAVFIAGYLLFGFIRGYGESTADATVLSSSNEFESLFANAFDLYSRAASVDFHQPPSQIYFADFLTFLPSQILPFEKIDGATWYIRLQGVEGTGLGYAFGVMAESAIGWGWLELLLKGTLIGWIMARIHRWYLAHQNQFWPLLAYVYLEIIWYHCFRASSFYFIPMMVLRFLPVYFSVRFLSRLTGGSASQAPFRVLRPHYSR